MTRLSAFVVALLLGSLAACDDEPAPDIAARTPSASTSTVSGSVSPTVPTETPVALTPEETVRAWVAARNQALQDGDTSAVDALSHPECETCVESLTPVQDVYEQGGYFDTAGWTVSSTKRRKEDRNSSVVTAGVTYEAGSTVPASGQPAVEYAAERHLLQFRLKSSNGVWLVEFLGTIS